MADKMLYIVKFVFIVFIAILAFGAGILPNIIPWCKKSTDILGIANAFSGGVFLAIAFLHILPEAASNYSDYMDKKPKEYQWLRHSNEEDDDNYFPLPFALAFVGYAFILLIDKVIFDTHSLIGEHQHGELQDPAQNQFIGNIKSSFMQCQRLHSDGINGENNINDTQIVTDVVKSYLSKNDKFAVRMSHALHRRRGIKKLTSKTFSKKGPRLEEDQASLFIDKTQISFGNVQEDLIENNEQNKSGISCG